MGIGKFLKKAAKKGRRHLAKATKKLHKGFKKVDHAFKSGIKNEIQSYKALKEGVSKVGGRVIKKLFPHGKDSVAKFLGKSIRVVAKGYEMSGTVVATMGDFVIIAGELTGQPELVAAGVAMDEVGNAVVVGAQTAEAASYALEYTIEGDQKAAMIALAKAVETGTTGILNTMSMGTFDNFVAAAVAISEGDYAGAAAQVGQAALDVIASETNVPLPTLVSEASVADESSTTVSDKVLGGQGEGDEEQPAKKRKITPTPVGLTERDHLYNCVRGCLARSESRRQGLGGKGLSMDGKHGAFHSQSHSVRSVEKPGTASLVAPGLSASDKEQTVPQVQELDMGDKFRSKHNLEIMRANTKRGFEGSTKVGQRKAVSGMKAVGATKQTVRSIGSMPPSQYKDQAYYTIEKMQRTSLKRDDQVMIEKDRKTRVMVLG